MIGILACECVTFAVLGIYRHTLLAGRARDFVTGQVEMVRRALTHATPEQVAEELEAPPRGLYGRHIFIPRDGPPRLEARTYGPSIDTNASTLQARHGGRNFAGGPDRMEIPGDFAGGRYGGGPRPAHMRLLALLPANATSTEPADLSLPQVVTALRDEYGNDALRFTDEPEPAVWVRMPTVGWWLMLPFSRYSSPPIPWPIVLTTLAAVAVMGAFVGLYSFHLSRPLRALSDAAASYRVGQRPELPLTGPDEIRAVTMQFNAMAERLERDDAERRVMLAGLPHDLRAPLARAGLRLALMDDTPDSPKPGLQRDLAEVGRIADQFVAYLRGLDHDTRSFKRTPLHEIVRDRGLVWRESGHDVTIERADVFQRDADADSLMRAVDNLVGNAFAHGSPPVAISGIASTKAGRAVYRIVVRDRGPGIPAAQREEALKPFTRLDAARGASGHCGLGLAVAQSVARLHDGRIELDGAEGGGLAATIVLPSTDV
ncbi:MAG: ATP-binding protein [Burkholderiaceae bacterium]